MKIIQIPLLRDNYGYLLIAEDGQTAFVDPGEAQPVIDYLEANSLELDYILNTHHHWDHTDGNLELKEKYGATIVGPEADAERIPGFDRGLSEGDIFELGPTQIEVIETPGHTTGHIAFYSAADKALFCGDTLFSLGCGRLFEGTPQQMWASFGKLTELPDDTSVYCGHEYTQACGRFCLQVEPDNQALKDYMAEVKEKRKAGLPTIPSTIGLEKQANVFLRAGSAERFAELKNAA